MKDYKFWLNSNKYKVVGFYPYTSGVDFKLLSQSFNMKTEEHDFLEKFCNEIKNMALAKGVIWDNKVVIEIQPILSRNDRIKASNVFVGCYDGIWSVGLGVWQDEWLEKNGSNKYFTE